MSSFVTNTPEADLPLGVWEVIGRAGVGSGSGGTPVTTSLAGRAMMRITRVASVPFHCAQVFPDGSPLPVNMSVLCPPALTAAAAYYLFECLPADSSGARCLDVDPVGLQPQLGKCFFSGVRSNGVNTFGLNPATAICGTSGSFQLHHPKRWVLTFDQGQFRMTTFMDFDARFFPAAFQQNVSTHMFDVFITRDQMVMRGAGIGLSERHPVPVLAGELLFRRRSSTFFSASPDQ